MLDFSDRTRTGISKLINRCASPCLLILAGDFSANMSSLLPFDFFDFSKREEDSFAAFLPLFFANLAS